MPRRAHKHNDVDSDASTEPENMSDAESKPQPRQHRRKKRVSELGGDTTIPLNDIKNEGVESESDDDRFKSPTSRKRMARSSMADLNDDNAEKRKRRKSAKQTVSFNQAVEVETQEPNDASCSQSQPPVRGGSPEPAAAAAGGPRTPKTSALARANQLNSVAQTPVPQVAIDISGSKYEEWMKMATDNKINANNAWNFALIDYFQDMSLLRNEFDNSINFQKASFTLDGCVKIWTSRVDSVGTETGKLLNNLADELRGTKNSEDREGEGEEGEGRAKKQKAHRSETTLAKSLAQLQVKKLDLEFTVDPLFKKTSADFDEGGAMGLLMNHLSVDEKIRVVFDAGDSRLEGLDEESPELISLPVDLTELRAKFLPSVEDVMYKTITESLANFRFSSDANADLLDVIGQNLNLDDDTNSNAPLGDNVNNMDFGGDGFDVGGDDGPAEDFFTGDQAVEEVYVAAEHGGDGGSGPAPLGPVENFDPRRPPGERDLTVTLTEGGEDMLDYFDATIMKNWAGPQHWKLRRIAKKADASGEANPTTRSKKEKVAFEIDFTQPARSSKELFAPATGATSLLLPGGVGATVAGKEGKRRSKKAISKRDKHLLPDDMHFSSAQLLRLFRKPKFTEWEQEPSSTSSSRVDVVVDDVSGRLRALILAGDDGAGIGDGEIDEHFWANAAAAHAEQQQPAGDEGDESGPIPFNTQFFNDEYDDAPAGFEDDDGGDPATEEQDLLAATQGQLKRTRPEFVNYAKKAKRVDVRKLKENIWKSLDIVVEHGEQDKDAESRMDIDGAEPTPTDPTEARTFGNVLSSLETAYPKDKMDEISTSFCFICLLHLANEQGLKIEVDPSQTSQQTLVDDDDDDPGATLRVGDISRLNVYRDPNATRSA